MDLLDLRSVVHLHVIEFDMVLVQLLRCRCVMVGSEMHLELVLHMIDHFEMDLQPRSMEHLLLVLIGSPEEMRLELNVIYAKMHLELNVENVPSPSLS